MFQAWWRTAAFLAAVAGAAGQGAENVLVVVNQASPVSASIGEYYARKRGIPADQVCRIRTSPAEQISRKLYDAEIAAPVARCLAKFGKDQILYVVTTLGTPLGIEDRPDEKGTESAAVDSELTLVMRRGKYQLSGPLPNPVFRSNARRLLPSETGILLVTRLAAYDFGEVRRLIDRSLEARNRGKVYLDLRERGDETGDDWLRTAAIKLPKGRAELEESTTVLLGPKEVIGFASWGSNDKQRKTRTVNAQWLPGSVMVEFVSTNARTFVRPAATWSISTWEQSDRPKWYKGSPQTLLGDYLAEGVTGASGHVYEPLLHYCARPDVVFPAYLSGRNLADSFYMAIPAVSWMNIVVGDPLMKLQ